MGFPEKIKNIVYESNRLCTRVRCILFDGKLLENRKNMVSILALLRTRAGVEFFVRAAPSSLLQE